MKQSFATERVVVLARKNRSVDERVHQVRAATVEHETLVQDKFEDKKKGNTLRLRNIYNHSLQMFEEQKK